MSREKKESKILNIKLSSDINEELVDICAESGLTKTAVVEKALAAYIENYRMNQKILQEYKREN